MHLQQLCSGYLSDYFAITVYYYNPNIYPESEYIRRVKEQEVNKIDAIKNPVSFIEGKYEPQKYYDLIKGHEKDSEGGDRCMICYRMRLEEAAKAAQQGDMNSLLQHSQSALIRMQIS